MDLKNVDPKGGNVEEKNSKSTQWFFSEIVKNELANKIQSFFQERDDFSACKTSLFIYFTLLIGME
jgi:hypothetical protein